MRRGGQGRNLQNPWRRRDDAAIASAGYLHRGWTARNCVCVTVHAACSLAISILIWSSRYRSNVHQLSNSGMVFPLYHYYRSGRHGIGWRRNRAGRGRRIQGEDVLMNVLGGRRLNADDIEHFYIEMKLGVPPVQYNFHVDTGSAVSWVFCDISTIVSTMSDLVRTTSLKSAIVGPHGLFVPEENSFVSCAGDTAALCQQLQVSSSGVELCKSSNNYRCVFIARYADESTYFGEVVNETFTVAMEDKSERTFYGSFGCVADKVRKNLELLPLLTDGLIGLGNCEGTLLDQWTTSKSVRQRILGVCLAKGVAWTALPSPASPVGYISMGIAFKEKFDQSNSVWSELMGPGHTVSCAFAAKLSYISFAGRKTAFQSAMIFDTGSDVTFLAPSVYGPLLKTLDVYATDRGYLRVLDNVYFAADEQRVCWNPPASASTKESPIQEFVPLKFAFEGISSASQQDVFQYLIVEPANYLIWDVITKKLCVNILRDDKFSMSNLGADMMREYLFVYDIENQRVRWQSDNCEMK